MRGALGSRVHVWKNWGEGKEEKRANTHGKKEIPTSKLWCLTRFAFFISGSSWGPAPKAIFNVPIRAKPEFELSHGGEAGASFFDGNRDQD